MTNLSDYSYVFDRLIKNNYPYIINLNSQVTNQDWDIYFNAKRIIYSLPNRDLFLDELMDKNIMLEFPLTSLYEANIISSIKESVFHELYEDNYNVCIVSRDMTSLNTDILNEYCLLINNFSFTSLIILNN